MGRTKMAGPIPQVLHFIWLGDDPLPKWAEENICSWIKFNLGWRVCLWTDRQVRDASLWLPRGREFQSDSFTVLDYCESDLKMYYDAHPNFGTRSDILRLVVLQLYGGLYLDVDVECWGPIENWMSRDALLIEESAATPGTISNALMAFQRNDPFLDFCLARLVADAENNKERVSLSTGPGFITRMHRAAQSTIEVVRDHKVFFPFDWSGPRIVHPETIAVHQWRGSWR